MYRFVVLALISSATVVGCGEKPIPKKPQQQVQCDSATCNGQLSTSTACADLSPSQYASGTATCSVTCEVDYSGCVPIAAPQDREEYETCTGNGQGNCAAGLACRAPEGELAQCLTLCDPTLTNMCGSGRECVAISSSATDGACFAEETSSEETCTLAGDTRCQGNVLQACNGSVWQLSDDCSTGARECGPAAGGGFACAVVQTCDVGATRCTAGAILETCNGTQWQATQDCDASGAACVPNGSGGYECVQPSECSVVGQTTCDGNILLTCDGSSYTEQDCGTDTCGAATAGGFACIPPEESCDFQDHVVTEGNITAAFDDDLYGFYSVWLDSPSRDSATEEIYIFIDPSTGGPAMGSSVPFTIDLSTQADYATCNFCVLGFRNITADSSDLFQANAGSITVTAYPSATGGTFSATLNDVKFHQASVNAEGSTVYTTDGDEWCVSQTYSKSATHGYLCDSSFEGQSFYWGCELVGTCSSGFWTPERCGDSGLVAQPSQSGAGAASCVTPPAGCDYTCADGTNSFSFYDDDVFRSHKAYIHTDDFSEQSLVIDNFGPWGGLTSPGSTDLTGDNSDISTCLTCVHGWRGDQYFLANSGTAIFDALATAPGDPISVSLFNIEMREVDGSWGDISGGDKWCVPYAVGTSDSARYPCSVASWLGNGVPNMVEGESACYLDDVIGCQDGVVILRELCAGTCNAGACE